MVGGLLLAAGISAPGRRMYLAGVGISAIGVTLVIMVLLWRLVRPAYVRWPIVILLPLIMIGSGFAVPQLLIGRPNSRPVWQAAPGFAPELTLVADRLFVHSEHTDQVIDPATGRTLLSVPAVGYGLTAGTDGSFVQYGDGRLVYRGPDGRERWSRKISDHAEVLAIADGWVVLSGCPRQGHACGISPDGRLGWQKAGEDGGSWLGDMAPERRQTSIDDIQFLGGAGAERAPEIVVQRTRDGIVVFDTAGHRVDARDEYGVEVGGRLVITAADGCQLAGYRAGQEVFRTTGLPCGGRNPPSAVAMFTDWLYLRTGPAFTGYAVHLTDGQVQRIGAVEIDNNPDADPRTAFPGEGVVVRRDHRQLTGIDPRSGDELWPWS